MKISVQEVDVDGGLLDCIPEDEGSMFLKNVGTHLQFQMAS
jgi:hypothetical protein